MIGSKYLGIMAVVAAIGATGICANSARAAEDTPAAGESESTVPRSPIRLSTVDYIDTDGGSGKLTIAGVALPGKELYLFLDDQPLALGERDMGAVVVLREHDVARRMGQARRAGQDDRCGQAGREYSHGRTHDGFLSLVRSHASNCSAMAR